MQDKITWIVPSPEKLSMWEAVIFIFDIKIWFLLFVTVFTLLFVMHTMARANIWNPDNLENQYYNSMQGTFFTLVSILVGKDFIRTPELIQLRIIIMFWAFCSMIIYSLFATNLARNCIHPQYEKHLNLDTLPDANLAYGVTPFTRQYFEAFVDTNDELKHKNLRPLTCRLLDNCLDMIQDHR